MKPGDASNDKEKRNFVNYIASDGKLLNLKSRKKIHKTLITKTLQNKKNHLVGYRQTHKYWLIFRNNKIKSLF